MHLVQVWPNPRVIGWDGDPSNPVDEHPQVELAEALAKAYDDDSHFVPYHVYDLKDGEVHGEAPRIKKVSLPQLPAAGLGIRFVAIVADVDGPKEAKRLLKSRHQADRNRGARLVAEWFDPQDEALEAHADELRMDVAYSYRTRGGYRVVWPLDEPVDDPQEYVRLVLAWRRHIIETTGGLIEPDELKDWGRCYRLCNVVRKEERQEWELVEPDSPTGLPLSLVRQLAGVDVVGKPRGGGSPFAKLGDARARGRVPLTIPEGKRNQALASLAGKLRAAGLDPKGIEAALTVVNEDKCDPPLPADEVTRLSESIGSYPAPPIVRTVGEPHDGGGWELELGSENEVSEVVLRMFEDARPGAERLVGDQGHLWQYSEGSGIWTPVKEGLLYEELKDLDGATFGKKGVLKVSRALSRNVYQICQLRRDGEGFFDHAPAGIAFSNGVVIVDEVSGAQLLLHSPSYRLTHTLPFAYDPKATAPMFDAVLDRCFEGCPDAAERKQLILEFIGACLLGIATKYQKALLMIGEGANGKSTILDVGSALFPSSARACVPPQLMGQEYHRAELAGKLLNVVTEVPETDVVHAESFRSFVSGDEVTGRYIREAPFKFKPKAGHLMAANNYPGASDQSHAYWRRWIAIQFPNVIPEDEQVEGLSQTIITKELPGVARMVIEAAVELMRRRHYYVPGSSKDELERWKLESDKVYQFADEKLEVSKGLTPCARVFDAFVAWCKRNGYQGMGHNKFSTRLARRGFEKGEGRGRYSWKAKILP